MSWAKTEDRTARTAPAIRAFLERFEREVDPENRLTVQERTKRAEWARKAYYQRLAMKSVAARRRRRKICQECGQAKEPEQRICQECWDKLPEPEL